MLECVLRKHVGIAKAISTLLNLLDQNGNSSIEQLLDVRRHTNGAVIDHVKEFAAFLGGSRSPWPLSLF